VSTERPLPHVALSAHAHNRMGLRRTDGAWLAERMADATTRVLVVAGNRLRPVDGAVEWISPDEAPEGTLVLLGEAGDVVHVAVSWIPRRRRARPRSGSRCGRC
jgi:NAD+ diphosphatase